MRIEDIRTRDSVDITFLLDCPADYSKFQLGLAEVYATEEPTFSIRQGRVACSAMAQNPEKLAHLFCIVRRNAALCMYANITFCEPGKYLQATVTPFTNLFRLTQKLSIGYDPARCKEKEIQDFASSLVFEPKAGEGGFLLALFRASATDREEWQDDGKEPHNGDGGEEGESIPETSFLLVGPDRVGRVIASEKNGAKFYRLQRLLRVNGAYFLSESPGGAGRLYLLQAQVDFVPNNVQVADSVRQELQQIAEKGNSYLKTWEQYQKVERQMLCRAVREHGTQAVLVSCGDDSGQYVFRLSDTKADSAALEKENDVVVYEQKPDFFRDDDDDSLLQGMDGDSPAKLCCCVVGVFGDELILKAQDGSKKGLSLSVDRQYFITLDATVSLVPLKRRELANRAVSSATCANPDLARIIEDGSTYKARKSKTEIPANSLFVKEKLFSKRSLTLVQEQAVSIALNTPDIALIQGPPGTGKTTVITAILERLNELQDKTGSAKGTVLVTSFQHDAVTNVIDRLSINALPTIKFGNKMGEEERGERATADKLEGWCKAIANDLQEKYPDLAGKHPDKEISLLLTSYCKAPSDRMACQLLTSLLTGAYGILPESFIQEKVVPLYDEFCRVRLPEESNQLLRRLALSLRSTPEAFVDDGADNAHVLLSALKKHAPDLLDGLKIAAILQEAEDCFSTPTPELLGRLSAARVLLMKALCPAPQFVVEKPNDKILNLIDDVRTMLGGNSSAAASSKEEIISDFYHELKYNPEAVRETIENYNFVYAATNQQCLGSHIMRRKGVRWKKTAGDEETSLDPASFYDTVVVDEAAKSSPPDLLIPMALAKRRIILVGDHRQLPHMIDDLVEEKMKDDPRLTDEEKELVDAGLRVSMFERLKTRLENLEQKDGIRRTITLDTQYRTHPVLGDLVSKYFYKVYDEGYGSGLPAKFFHHNLPTGDAPACKPCYWLRVPCYGRDDITRVGTSSARRPEAAAIVRTLKAWMDSPQGAGLTFGVISFYRAQCGEILRAMGQAGMSVHNEIAEQYRYLTDAAGEKKERLRIGTVDSFQGMEFDVVFLSVVRTSYSLGRSKHPLGFLTPNRLCVALSRQKKVLVIAGDSDLAASRECAQNTGSVAVLHEFWDICRKGKEGGML